MLPTEVGYVIKRRFLAFKIKMYKNITSGRRFPLVTELCI